MATPIRVVLDASVVVRALTGPSDEARRWLDAVEHGPAEAFAPDLIYAETADSLVQYGRKGELDLDGTIELLGLVAQLPVEIRSSRSLFGFAYALAMTKGVTAYDAHYLALAEAEDAVLVTADRGLAAAASRSVLLE